LISGDIKLAEDDSALAGEAPWHRRDPDEVAAALETSVASGLADIEVRERLGKSGHNVLPRLAARSPLAILTAQFQSVPVAMLGGAAVLSLATGALIEAAAILGVVIANAAIGFQTESRAERTITSLSSRGPRTTLVAADARLATVRDLTVSEATLTGESMPATKAVDTLAEANVPLSSRTNMVYRGTVVTGGSGTAIVVATGPSTEAGRIGRLVGSSATPETPMQRQLGALGSSLVWPVLAASGAILGIGWLRGIGLLQ